MPRSTQTIDAQVRSRIYGNKRGWVFTPQRFQDLGSSDAIDSALRRLVADGVIRKLARGLYDYPAEHPKLGLVSPSVDAVVYTKTSEVIHNGSPLEAMQTWDLMVTILPADTPTDREWNFRDDNGQHFFGDISEDQAVLTLTLNWKPDAATGAIEVGRYRLDLRELLKAGFVRESPRGILLRFQRDGEVIEIATNRSGPSLVDGRRPRQTV